MGTGKRKLIRGELLLRALDLLERVVYTHVDFAGAFLASTKSNYLPLRNFTPRNYKTVAGKLLEEFRSEKQLEEERQEELKRIENLIYRLKKDGLIKKVDSPNGNPILTITAKGRRKRDLLEKSYTLQLPDKNYDSEKSSDLIIISFDISEKERHKRDWLRSVLKNLGLRMLQRSVWIGKVKISEDFLNDLRKINIINSVEIFSVGKTGTIKQLA